MPVAAIAVPIAGLALVAAAVAVVLPRVRLDTVPQPEHVAPQSVPHDRATHDLPGASHSTPPAAAEAQPAPALTRSQRLAIAEEFDLGGLPGTPTDFEEQRLFEALRSHTSGDLADACALQCKLAAYYAGNGDAGRAAAAAERARMAADEGAVSLVQPPQEPVSAPDSGPATGVADPVVTGRYWGKEGVLLHTWDFCEDGTFLHRTVVSGAGTSVGQSERGTFHIEGDELVLSVTRTAGAFVTPAVGGRDTILGGSADEAVEVRRIPIRVRGTRAVDGLDLGGVAFSPRSW